MISQKHIHLLCSDPFIEEWQWISINPDYIQRSLIRKIGEVEFQMQDGRFFKAQDPENILKIALNLHHSQYE